MVKMFFGNKILTIFNLQECNIHGTKNWSSDRDFYNVISGYLYNILLLQKQK